MQAKQLTKEYIIDTYRDTSIGEPTHLKLSKCKPYRRILFAPWFECSFTFLLNFFHFHKTNV